MQKLGALTLVAAVWLASSASANIDIPGMYDARSLGMASTGVAFLDSAAGMPINPALLDQIEDFSFSGNVMLLVAQSKAPYPVTSIAADGQVVQTAVGQTSEWLYVPVPFLGGAYRLSEQVVVGLAFSPLAGTGVSQTYRPAPDVLPELEVSYEGGSGLFEALLSVSWQLVDELALAVTWRPTFVLTGLKQPTPIPDIPSGVWVDPKGRPIYNKLELGGYELLAYQVGLFYRPCSWLQFGASYRSKVTVEGEGSLYTDNAEGDGTRTRLEARQESSFPHSLRVGAALKVLEERLLFSTDLQYHFYSQVYKVNRLEVRSPDGTTQRLETRLNWTNAYSVGLGVEYRLSERIAVRGGYAYTTSAVPDDYARAGLPAPGAAHQGSVGLGVALFESINLDLGVSLSHLSSQVEGTDTNSGQGTYANDLRQFSVSVTYH